MRSEPGKRRLIFPAKRATVQFHSNQTAPEKKLLVLHWRAARAFVASIRNPAIKFATAWQGSRRKPLHPMACRRRVPRTSQGFAAFARIVYKAVNVGGIEQESNVGSDKRAARQSLRPLTGECLCPFLFFRAGVGNGGFPNPLEVLGF